VSQTLALGLDQVIARLHDAVCGGASVPETVAAVQRSLRSCLTATGWLPASCRRPAQDCYARHLVHRDADDRFSVVAMVWSPGQKTPVHDHSGVWCVEGIYKGRLAITRYDLLGAIRDGVARFRRHDEVHEGIGATGALIPPVEFHTIENASDAVAISVHVYGCDMKRCRAFLPREDGTYRVCEKELSYTSCLA
jgi:predicted metal-dependent enzyme (double-stranded beta helix superfamily)